MKADRRIRIAKNPNAQARDLIEIASSKNGLVLSALLDNPNLPPEALLKIAQQDLTGMTGHIRRKCLRHPNCPTEVFHIEIDRDSFVAASHIVERNDTIPWSVWDHMAAGRGVFVAVDDDRLPVDILERLSINPNITIRIRVAKNPSTPMDVVVRMALEDADERVREYALNRLDLVGILGV